MPKRLILANDLPGIGKVALSASLPLVAACQVEAALLPTVLLSSHTGGFSHIARQETGDFLNATLFQWQQLSLAADGLLLGYCPHNQMRAALVAVAKAENIPLILDPVMGDAGKLYTGFDEESVSSMRLACAEAQLILPNLTEAALLTGRSYLGVDYQAEDIAELVQALTEVTAGSIVLTGISFTDKEIGVAYYNHQSRELTYHMSKKWSAHFFGTGDMVASLVAVAVVEGLALTQALPMILDFVDKSLATTLELGRDLKYGVFYEAHLMELAQNIQELKAQA